MIDEIGNHYGELTVLSPDYGDKLKWKCQCSCGNIIYVSGVFLRNGNTKSCGCKNIFSHEVKEIAKELQKLHISYK